MRFDRRGEHRRGERIFPNRAGAFESGESSNRQFLPQDGATVFREVPSFDAERGWLCAARKAPVREPRSNPGNTMNMRRGNVDGTKVCHYRDEGDYLHASQGDPVLLIATGRTKIAWDCWAPVSLWSVLHGQARVTADELCADLETQSVLVAEYGSRVSCRTAGTRSATLLGLLLPPDWLRGLMDREFGDLEAGAPIYPTVLRNDSKLQACLARLAELTRGDVADSPAVSLLVEQIALRVVTRQRELEALVPRCPGQSLRHRRQVLLRLLRARNCVEHSIGSDSSVADLAEVARMSRAHFVRLYGDVFGQPPHRHRLQSRLLLARDMLVRRECAIQDLCAKLGFENCSGFARAFRRQFGVSPTQFRAEAQARRDARPGRHDERRAPGPPRAA